MERSEYVVKQISDWQGRARSILAEPVTRFFKVWGNSALEEQDTPGYASEFNYYQCVFSSGFGSVSFVVHPVSISTGVGWAAASDEEKYQHVHREIRPSFLRGQVDYDGRTWVETIGPYTMYDREEVAGIGVLLARIFDQCDDILKFTSPPDHDIPSRWGLVKPVVIDQMPWESPPEDRHV